MELLYAKGASMLQEFLPVHWSIWFSVLFQIARSVGAGWLSGWGLICWMHKKYKLGHISFIVARARCQSGKEKPVCLAGSSLLVLAST